MPKQSQDLHAFLLDELRDVYDAEKQLVKSLPRMAKAATDDELKEAITEHLEQTKGHVQRIEECFEHLEQKARSKPCKGMKGILEEGREMLEEDMEDPVMDAAIAAGGRKIEHYEIVSYESLRGVAEQLGLSEVADLLGQTLEEEQEADRLLTEICQRVVQETASLAETEEPEEEMANRASGKSARSRAAGSKTKSRGAAGHAAHALTDHEEIRQWAEERRAKPACVKGTGKRGGVGMIRLDFPGYSGAESLQPIDWDQWFEQFDQNKLSLLVQEETAGGQRSNFNKLVSREKQGPKTRAAH